MSRERAVILDLITLRKHDTAIISQLWKKRYQTCRIPDETKKILGPKINPPNFQALIDFSKPWNFSVKD